MQDEQRVWLVQCLCGPRRHAIAAYAFEAPSDPAGVSLDEHGPALASSLDTLIGSRAINPWCDLCGSKRADWLFEVGRTQFATMAEAQPALQACQAEQRQAAEHFAQLRRAAMSN